MKKLLLGLLILMPLLMMAQVEERHSLQWIVTDRDFGREFLRAYIDLVTKLDPMADLEIQETDELRVTAIIKGDGKLEVGNLFAKSRGGALNKLDMKIVKQLPPGLISRLLHRQYLWDYIDQVQVSGVTGEIINVFQERNYKQCRDAFWWTHRRVDIMVFPRLFLRVNPKYALFMEIGREDIGFPAVASRTMNVGLGTEIFKFHLTMPVAYPLGIKGSDSHPLDGSYGAGLRFDTPKFGGSISFQDMEFRSGSDIDYYDMDNYDIVYNSFSGHLYYSFTNRIGSPPDEPGLIPQGSLRMKFGATFVQFVYGKMDTTGDKKKEKKFVKKDWTEKLELVQGFVRAEYATDMNERYFNRWKLFSQLNIGLTGFGSFQLGVTYTLMEWLGISLATSYSWTGIEFQYTENTVKQTFTWNPGWYLIPSVAIYF